MTAREAILSVDVGTSSVKALLVDRDGTVVARWRVPHPTHRPEPDAAEQDPCDWWRSVCLIARRAIGHRIASVAITGQMHGLVMRDVDGRNVGRAMNWQDRRGAATLPALGTALRNLDPMRSDIDIHPGELATSWHWVATERPDTALEVATVSLPKDDVIWRLTGRHVTDPSDAVGTGLFDVTSESWDPATVRAARVPRRALPAIEPTGSVVGTVTIEAARATGLSQGTPVVVAGGDAAAGAFGANVTRPGQALLMLSTGCQILMPLAPETPLHVSTVWPSAGPGATYLRVAATSNGGSAIDWALATFGTGGHGTGDDATPPWFVPYLDGEREPAVPRGHGAFLRLSASHHAADLLAAVIEGVTFAIADRAERAGLAIGSEEPLDVGGGGIRRQPWLNAVARVFARPIRVVDDPDLSALGAARIAATTLGWSDPEAAFETWLASATEIPSGSSGIAARARLLRWREVTAQVSSTGPS